MPWAARPADLFTRPGLEHPLLVQQGGVLGVDSDGRGGLVIRALDLWLDPPGQRPAAFVSHAHASGALESAHVLASRETLELASSTGSGVASARAIDWDGAVELPIAREYGGGTARLSIAPAGHLPGAAQLVVDHPRGRFVYTGDWSADADGAHPAGATVPCDELAVTTAFALPIFRFERPADVLASIATWCREALSSKVTPVVLAQSPGPAQSILLALAAHGVPFAADEDVGRACRAYAKLGIPSGEPPPASPGTSGVAIVASTRTRRSALRIKGRSVVAYASGWAVLDAAVEQRRADAAFAMADQADSDASLALVRASGARVVHAAYGDARAFAELLRARGFERVSALESPAIDERGDS